MQPYTILCLLPLLSSAASFRQRLTVDTVDELYPTGYTPDTCSHPPAQNLWQNPQQCADEDACAPRPHTNLLPHLFSPSGGASLIDLHPSSLSALPPPAPVPNPDFNTCSMIAQIKISSPDQEGLEGYIKTPEVLFEGKRTYFYSWEGSRNIVNLLFTRHPTPPGTVQVWQRDSLGYARKKGSWVVMFEKNTWVTFEASLSPPGVVGEMTLFTFDIA